VIGGIWWDFSPGGIAIGGSGETNRHDAANDLSLFDMFDLLNELSFLD
jgi:hypothetical protein